MVTNIFKFATAVALTCPVFSDAASSTQDIMAIYFGDWHVDPDMSSLHGDNWTEWNLVVNAQPRYPNHFQPNLPMESLPGFGQGAAENSPAGMGAKLQTALDHGVNAMLFDWYWYAEKGTNGNGGQFLNGALNDGFMKIPIESNKMKFALMWANQDWVDVHPAKRGWHGSGRAPPVQREIVYPNQAPRGVPAGGGVNMLLQFDGYMNASVYRGAFKYVAQTYFTHPNYYKVPTKLANGTVAQCAYYAIYQMDYLVHGIGSVNEAAQVLADFETYAEEAGTCLHLVSMVAGSPKNSDDTTLKDLSVKSTAAYCWMKIMGQFATWPNTNYTEMASHQVATYTEWSNHFNTELGIKFSPVISVGWDPSPRTLISDKFFSSGYPWGSAYSSSPSEFQAALSEAKGYLDSGCSAADRANPDKFCPPLLINAWNEWSEGAYLEPDQRYQYGKLQAVKAVFGTAT